MSDIVERLRIYATDDHERGCQGRCYDCSCGYDDKRDPLLKEAAAEIERLRAALQDPATVHINMLRGIIAKPTLAQIIHLYGDASIRAALTAQPAAPKQKTEVKLNINAERFLAAVDREGDHEIGVGLFAQPAEGEK